MTAAPSSLALLQDPVAEELLGSSLPAQLAYVWPDGTPRVVPICFHWTGDEIVMGTPPAAPKVQALETNPAVSLTINTATWPFKVLQVRGTATLARIEGIVPEYALAVKRYLGNEAGQAWLDQAALLFPVMVRIGVRPEWVNILDFQTRYPSSIMRALSR